MSLRKKVKSKAKEVSDELGKRSYIIDPRIAG